MSHRFGSTNTNVPIAAILTPDNVAAACDADQSVIDWGASQLRETLTVADVQELYDHNKEVIDA